MVKVYGVSDDLVEIEGSSYREDEIGCYDKDVRIRFYDGTVIRIGYSDYGGVWRVDVEAQGVEKHRLDVCESEDGKLYSDCFYISSEIQSHSVIDKNEPRNKFISLEALLQYPIRWGSCDRKNANPKFLHGVESVIEFAERLPAADTVLIVRCKECRHHHDYGTHYCDILRMACPDDSEFYCSYGEREENNGVD